jgi:dienelactone hydrolase
MKYILSFIHRKYVFSVLLIGFFSCYIANAQKKNNIVVSEIIYYTSDSSKLKGYLYKPEGKGPFPVYMWNHDEGKYVDSNRRLVNFWVKHGFIFFMPIRSGQGDNPGTYIVDAERQIARKKEMESLRWKQVYALHKKANDDVIAALKWIKTQPYADTNNIVVSGEGYGAIQVLLTAAKDGKSSLGVKSFVPFFLTPSYRWNILWADSLKEAINMAKRPIFLIQERNNRYSSPIDSVGPVLDKKQFPNRYKVFPSTEGFDVIPKYWEKDVMKYLKDCKVKRMK